MSVSSINVVFRVNLKEFSTQMQNVSREFEKVGKKMQEFGKNLSMSLTPALGIIGGGALKMAADMEQAQISFETMLKDADKAKSLIQEMKDFAASTPFEFPEIQNAGKSLLAFQISSEKIVPTLKSIGDIAAGLNIPMGELAEIYGKARIAGRLYAEDINQLTGRGIPIIGELAKQFKVSEGEVKKLVEQGKVGFPQLEKAFNDLTSSGGMFEGMMEKQSKSAAGLASTLKDAVGQGLAEIGNRMMEVFRVKEVLAALIGVVEKMVQWFKELNPLTQRLVLIVGALAAALGPVLVAIGYLSSTVIPLLVKQITAAFSFMAAHPFGALAIAAAGLAVALTPLLMQMTELEKKQKIITDVNKEAAKSIVEEKLKVESLFKSLTDQNVSYKDKIKNLNELKVISPKYFGDLTLEKAGTDEAKKSVEEYSVALINNAKIKASQEKMVELQKKIVDLEMSNGKEQVKWYDYVEAGFKGMFRNKYEVAEEMGAKINERIKSEIAGLNEQIKVLSDYTAELQKNTGAKDDNNNTPLGGPKGINPKEMSIESKGMKPMTVPVMMKPKLDVDEAEVKHQVEKMGQIFKLESGAVLKTISIDFTETISTFMDGLVGALVGNSSMSDLLGSMLGTLAGLMQNIGKQLIATGAAVTVALANLFTPGVAVAAGAFLVGAGALLKSQISNIVGDTQKGGSGSIPAFADGGLIFGPTLGLMGEYSNARSNPEVIAPLDKLKAMIADQGTQNINVIGKISGNDLRLVMERADRDYKRVR